jgi:hypothetical protein
MTIERMIYLQRRWTRCGASSTPCCSFPTTAYVQFMIACRGFWSPRRKQDRPRSEGGTNRRSELGRPPAQPRQALGSGRTGDVSAYVADMERRRGLPRYAQLFSNLGRLSFAGGCIVPQRIRMGRVGTPPFRPGLPYRTVPGGEALIIFAAFHAEI